MHLALSCDLNFIVGLYATTFSVLKNRKDTSEHVTIHLFLDAIPAKQLERYEQTMKARFENVSFVHYDMEAVKKQVMGLKGMHGNLAPYYLLIIPSLVKGAEKLVWLDVDTLVYLDISAIKKEPLDNIIGAVPARRVEESGERKYYEVMGLSKDDKEFNSGFVYIDVKKWKEEKVTQKLLELAPQHMELTHAADQSILNVFFNNQYTALSPVYNRLLSPTRKVDNYEGYVNHFFGSPKPWELLSPYLNEHYAAYKPILKELNLNGLRFIHLTTASGRKRQLRISKTYLKALRS